MKDQIPFCQLQNQIVDNRIQIPQSFITKYGQPWPQDNNLQYISAGIVNMVQELVKTIVTYFTPEL
jgi:hypothetical protein